MGSSSPSSPRASPRASPTNTSSPFASSSSPSSSSSKQMFQGYNKKVLSRMAILCLSCVVLYDAYMTYEYSKSMRLLLSLYQPGYFSSETSKRQDVGEEKEAVVVESRPYGQRIGSIANQFFHNDKSGTDNSPPDPTAVAPVAPSSTTEKHGTFFETDDGDSSRMNDDHEVDDEPWIMTAKKRGIDTVNENVQDNRSIDENILFQNAIRENEHVSMYRNYQEYIQRSKRFPSVEERVKLYMSTWYNPPIFPCHPKDNVDQDPRIHYNYVTRWNAARKEHVTTVILRQSQSVPINNHNNHKLERLFTVDNVPQHSRLTFAYNYTVLSNAPYKNDAFIEDALRYFTPSLRRLQYPDTVGSSSVSHFQEQNLPLPVPILLQVGDSEQFKMYAPDVGFAITRPVIPVIKKFRYSMEEKELSAIIMSKNKTQCNVDGDKGQPRRISRTVRLADNESLELAPFRTQPIVSIMSHTKRHFGPLNEIPVSDRPWHTKLNMAVYRGALTGMNKATVNHPDSESSTDEEEILWCQLVPRCNLVLQHGTSTLVDAKLTKVPFVTGVTEGDRVKPVLNGVTMEGESMNYHDMLQYKAIIMLEGNDVASGLKWALFSNSVVMMSKPTCTSWAMEELLRPYVHYIPLKDDLSNVEEQVQWMIDHDVEAEQIANNGRLWMTDLVFHPDVTKDTDAILDETFRRYLQHFQYNPTLDVSELSSSQSSKVHMASTE